MGWCAWYCPWLGCECCCIEWWCWCACWTACWTACWWECECGTALGCLALYLTLPANELPLPCVPMMLCESDISSSSPPRLRNLTNPSSATSIVEPVAVACSCNPACVGVCLPRVSRFLIVCTPFLCRLIDPLPSWGKCPMVPDFLIECLSNVPVILRCSGRVFNG